LLSGLKSRWEFRGIKRRVDKVKNVGQYRDALRLKVSKDHLPSHRIASLRHLEKNAPVCRETSRIDNTTNGSLAAASRRFAENVGLRVIGQSSIPVERVSSSDAIVGGSLLRFPPSQRSKVQWRRHFLVVDRHRPANSRTVIREPTLSVGKNWANGAVCKKSLG